MQTKELCKLLAQACPLGTAAEAIGLSPRTLRSWLQHAEADDVDADLSAFAAAITRARAKGRVTLLKRIIEAGKTDWRANAFVLARVAPAEFGRAAEETTNFASPSYIHVSTRYVHDDSHE
jgi:hypothetical protein